MLGMIRHRTAAVIAAITLALSGLGAGIAWAASSVNVPETNGQLTGSVYICVNTANESQQYVELGHPAPGNCAAGYLQYAANQPASTSSAPAALVNSESFAYGTTGTTPCAYNGETTYCVSLPAGTHITGTPVVTDENSLPAAPIAPAEVDTVDDVTGLVTVSWPGPNFPSTKAPDQIQVTYDYSS